MNVKEFAAIALIVVLLVALHVSLQTDTAYLEVLRDFATAAMDIAEKVLSQ